MHWTDLANWWQSTPTRELIWIGIGLTAQLLFSMRFLVQWVATERARASVIPETFWYFSSSAARCCSPMPAIVSIRCSCSGRRPAS